MPYILSATLMVITFLTINTISECKSMLNMGGGAQLMVTLKMGSFIIGFFSVIFLFYTNGFLIKQRKKEIGLYCILGLEKKHVAKVLLHEMLMTMSLAVFGGMIVGSVFNRLLFLLLLRAVKFDMTMKLEFHFSPYITTFLLYTAIFVAMYIKNLLQVQLANPINLLKGSNQGEKEPKASWFFALLGCVSLGIGYYMAVKVNNPADALMLFFVAVIFVIIGTNLIFSSASIYVLKFMKNRKRFYYRSKNFISVSGMIYRMKQNAIGLANICILSTMVIVSISSVVSLYIGQKDIMEINYPRDISIKTYPQDQKIDGIKERVESLAKEYKVKVSFQGDIRMLQCLATKKDGRYVFFNPSGNVFVSEIDNLVTINFMSIQDYNRFTHSKKHLEEDNQVLIFDASGKKNHETLLLEDETYAVAENLTEFNHIKIRDSVLNGEIYIVMKEFDLARVAYQEFAKTQEIDKKSDMVTYYADVTGDAKTCTEFETELLRQIRADAKETNTYIKTNAYHADYESWYTEFGGLLFIGSFFGIIFSMATVLIIYYKQITEGYDDRERFIILQKVGMSKYEVKKTIHKQILLVFALPIAFAICHIGFALPMLKSMFQAFGLFNTTLINLSTLLTVLIYAICYGIVYALTAKAYYKIVKE